jgi:hypothetical protein
MQSLFSCQMKYFTSNYRIIVVFATVTAFLIIPGGIFMALSASSQSSKVADNITESHKNSSGIASPPSARSDRFGIKEIYPTKQGGREWYINMKNPANDSLFAIGTGKDDNITRQSDGSWRIAYQKVRMSVDTPPGTPMWKNVEITGYAKVNSLFPHNANSKVGYTDLAWFARGGRHTQSSPCDGLALIGGIHADGTVGWKKEIWFTGGYTDELGQAKITNSIVGKWIGWKVIMYNINNNSAVKMESYLDDKNDNHWVKVTDIIDDGGWFANSPDGIFYSANCGRAKDHIITEPGPDVAFRSDNLVWDFKNLSVREIQPPIGGI